jgi:multiple sugar transport system substrate-binding protein
MPLCLLGPDDPALSVLRDTLRSRPEWQTTLTIVPWPEYRDRLMEALTAARTPYQAVCVPGHVWIPELADAGYLAPLDDIIESLPADLVAEYRPGEVLPAIGQESRYEGQQYMLPLFSDGHILFYRADKITLLTGNGVPIVSPGSLSELAASAHQPPEVYGLALKAHPSEIFLDWLPFLWEEGGELLDPAGQPAFASTAGIRALRAYCDLRRFCPPDTHTYGNAELAAVIKEGRAALATTWGGQAAAIMLDPDNVYRQAYQAATYPRPWNATWGIAMPANQPDTTQRAVLTVLLKATGPEQDRQITRVAGSPVRHSSYTPEEMGRYPWLPAQYEMLQRAGTLPIHPKTGAFLGALYEAVYAAFTSQVTPRQALSKANTEVRRILGESS